MTRDKIIKTFTKYARLGLAAGRLDALEVYARINGCARTRSEARELLAVYDTVRFLKISGKEDALRAVCCVYFSQSRRQYSKDGINDRVLRYSMSAGCDARTVYRQLAYAVKVYEAVIESY